MIASFARVCLELIQIEKQSNIFYFFYNNLIFRNLRFNTFASLMFFMTLTFQSFASLLTLTLTHLSLAQHFFAFDHVFHCTLRSLSQHVLLVSSRCFYSSLTSFFLILLTWSIDEFWLRCHSSQELFLIMKKNTFDKKCLRNINKLL